METVSRDSDDLLVHVESVQKSHNVDGSQIQYRTLDNQQIDTPNQTDELSATIEQETLNGKLVDDSYVNGGFEDRTRRSSDIDVAARILEPPPMEIEQKTIADVEEAEIIMPESGNLSTGVTQPQENDTIKVDQREPQANNTSPVAVSMPEPSAVLAEASKSTTTPPKPADKSLASVKHSSQRTASATATPKSAPPTNLAIAPKVPQVRSATQQKTTTRTPVPSKVTAKLQKETPKTHQVKKEPPKPKPKPPTSSATPKTLPPRAPHVNASNSS
ncbi:unnamed protein product [Toxocara canis]|uniref:PAM2 domain-containing protein n=1 Tax=Toxocara canis TaxID=6265 RepID=A0A183UK66_TOXCA|nr:unnamed protein product [Toxocara canis]